jgi:hypothetical protein
MKAEKRALASLNRARMPSSSRYGAQSAEAKGHPRMPAMANQNIPSDVLKPPRQFMNAAAPRVTIYMAKLEGRKAVLAWKLPGLMTVAMRKKIPMRLLRVVLVTMNRRVWHMAHPKAKPRRME